MKLRTKLALNGLPLLAVLMLGASYAWAQNARYVDPMLGVDGGGNTFAGATLPFGMLKAGPDTGDNTANSGWTPDGLINGFTQTHVSGTGGGAKYGNVLLQPTTGDMTSSSDRGSARANERASTGYYGVTLTRYNIGVEIASARRSAIYRFTYPAAEKSNLLIDAGHCLTASEKYHENQTLVASSAKIVSPTEISGFTTILGGWNIQPVPYTVYFYAVTDTPASTFGAWNGKIGTNGKLAPGSHGETESKGRNAGAWFTFATHANQVVQMKIGISFISEAQAKANATAEIPSFDFEAIHTQAQKTWNEALAPISIEGAGEDDLRQFYTALYHTMLMPVDRTGENPLFQSTEPYYDDFYATWDTFRSSSPLLTLISEKRETDIVRALVDLYRHEGWLPDARSGNYNGRVQGGSDADMTIVDGYLKHLPGIDWQTAFKAVEHDAEATPSDPRKEGRGDLEDWRKLGYLSIEGSDRPASKSMEYAANDYAVALLAKGLGNDTAFRKYSARASNWKNLWDTDASDHGFSGFIWPRHRDGSWKPSFDPLLSGSWGSDSFYEGNSWTYSTFVPQDVAGLIKASGGDARFIQRMDAFFDLPDRYDVGNEPGFLAPYLYIWAGRPDATQQHIRAILAKNYHSGPRGLPGNDDSGAMSSWYAFAKLGFYPNAAQDVYLIGSPAFRHVTIKLANGRSLVLETEGNVTSQPYIAQATWNGRPFDRAWFTHEELMQGGTLHFTMSFTPTHWGSSNPPPSLSDPSRH
jgi:predicted alpha-1,2-mannosidase